ncbi:MAG: beta-ketoacyl-[acyl-carrier-protein] synthase family protein [Verrucomicrobiota bacterium]
MNHNRRRAVITGLGPITCSGTGKKTFWEAVRAGKSGIGPITCFDASRFRARCAGEVHDWDPSSFFTPHRLKRLDRYAQLALSSAFLALEDAGFCWSKETPQYKVGVSFGTGLAGISGAEAEHERFLNSGLRAVNHSLALQVFGGAAHANIAIECGFRGPGTTNSNSCASGVIAVGEALRMIRDGMAEVMIAGGAEAPLSPLTFAAFDFIKTMSRWQGDPALAYRPFDLNRDGFVIGEGAASLVIEEYGHAVRRGAHIYAELVGYSLNNEAYHMTSPLPSGEAVVHCMRGALRDAGISPCEVDYINAHASSTQLNDANETACIKTVFGDHARKLMVSGTKPFTAHPLGASGAIETAICALAIDEGYVPPTLNYRMPDPACDLDVVANTGRSHPLRCVLNNAFGFGGINASLVLRGVE